MRKIMLFFILVLSGCCSTTKNPDDVYMNVLYIRAGDMDNGFVYLSPEIAEYLNEHYSPDREFSGCLEYVHKVIDGNISFYINALTEFFPNYHASSNLEVCNSYFYKKAPIHSHTFIEDNNHFCYFGKDDIEIAKEYFKSGSVIFIGMCDKNKFFYIERNDFNEKWVKVKI